MEGSQLGKRTRQACEPCRRKKSRCPGERPVCSYCHRLGQQCVYKSGVEVPSDSQQARHNRKMEFRLGALENKMDRLIQHLSPDSPNTNTNPRPVSSSPGQSALLDPAMPSDVIENSPQEGDQVTSDDGNSQTQLRDMAQTYLSWSHCQPVTLFDLDTFVESIQSRDKELLASLQAITGRFPPGSLTPEKQERVSGMATMARRAVMIRITDGEVELSTLQSLCLLSIVDFADGKPARASLNLVMADHIKHSVQSSTNDRLRKERDMCFKSISMLQKLYGCIVPAMDMMSNLSPQTAFTKMPDPGDVPAQDDSDDASSEIILYAARLGDVWQMARAYAASKVKPDAPPPWDPQSDFSAIMNRHLNLDCWIPLKFRYCANSNIVQLSADELNERRHYWSAFLFIQLVYSTIPCLLNHPFLISMRLRHFRHTIPQSFIQQSYEQLTRNMGWIVYFLDLLEKKSFQLSDPVFGHCVAIVSTIHLQHSFVKDTTLQRKATQGFDKCMRFLRRLGSMWPNVANMADNLQRLKESVVVVSPRDTSSIDTPLETPSFSIDARLLRDILIYDRAGQPNASVDESLLGRTLASQAALRDAEERTAETEYNLIGSAGLSGHTAVVNQGLVYAPEGETDADRDGPGEDPLNANPQAVSDMGIAIGDIYLEGIGGYGDQDNMFMQANDYGRAIGRWLDFESA